MIREVDVAIIGAGSAGLYALSEVRKRTNRFVLINGGPLGTTCARVGCMPSKAAIQAAEDYHRRDAFQEEGIRNFGSLRMEPSRAWEHVRRLRDDFVDGVKARTTDKLGDRFIDGYACFLDQNTLEVEGETIHTKCTVIASGSRPIVPRVWESFGGQILTTDTLFEQTDLPMSIAVIGLGGIGLEMGQTLHRLGLQVTGVELLDVIGGLTDPVVNRAAIEILGQELPLWLGKPAAIKAKGDDLEVSGEERSVIVNRVLVSMGRRPNLANLGLDKLGVDLDERGLPPYNPATLQVADLPIFIAGDANGERPVQHEAADEGRIAGYNAVREHPTAFKRKTPMVITFCDPNIVQVGKPLSELDASSTAIGTFDVAQNGRAQIMGKNKGLLRVYADKADGRLLGAAMIAPHAEHLGHLLAWSIQQRLTVFDLLKMPFYHPVVEEALQSTLYDLVKQLNRKEGELLENEFL